MEIFECAKKKLRIQKYPDTRGQALFSSKSLGLFGVFFFVSTRLLSKNSMDLREKADFKQSPFNIPLFYR